MFYIRRIGLPDTRFVKASGFLFWVILVLFAFQLKGQVLSVYDMNTDHYPVVEARFHYLDQQGRQVFNMEADAFGITENGRRAPVLDIENPRRSDPRKLSVVLAFDVSSSMEQERLDMARQAALEFVDLLPLELSECAISSFDHLNYLNCDFTHSQQRLRQAIDSLSARGGTNYNSGFLTPFSGALRVASEGRFKRVVVFLTDGLGGGDRRRIIRMANEKDITVYPVTIGMQTPSILKEVATHTGGRYFGKVEDVERAREIYQEILLTAQSIKAGTLRWRSPNGCSDLIHTTFDYKGEQFRTRYRLLPEQRVSLEIKPRLVQLDKNDSTSSCRIQLKAVHADFRLQQLRMERQSGFSIHTPQALPYTIPEDSTGHISITRGNGSAGSGYTPIAVVNDRCPDYHIYAKAGPSIQPHALKVIQPNGGEVFTPGTETLIRWKGIAKSDPVHIYHSGDGGKKWNRITSGSGMKHAWQVPADTGSRHLIRIDQNGYGPSAGGMDPLLMPGGQEYKAHNARFIRGDEWIVTLEDDHTLKLWEGETGNFIRSYPLHNDWIYDVSMSPDDDYLVTASDDGSAKVLDLTSGKVRKKLQVNNWGINHALFSHDGKQVITAGDDGAIRFWNVNTGEHLYGILAHRGWVMDIDLSPDGTRLVSSGDDKLIRIWDVKTGKHIRTLTGHQSWVNDVGYSPDGTRIISASHDSTFRIWNVSSRRQVKVIRGHDGKVYSASYSPGGTRIVTASRDGTLRLWTTNNQEQGEGIDQVSVLQAPPGQWFHEAHFGPGGQRVIAATSKRQVKVWLARKREPFQRDVSDQPFRIVSPRPRLRDIAFGRHFLGRAQDTAMRGFFKNTSPYPIQIESVSLKGEDKQDFQLISPGQGFTLPSGDTAPLEMSFRARSVGNKEVGIHVATPTDTLMARATGRGMLRRYDIPLDRVHMGHLEPGENRDSAFMVLRNRGNSSLNLHHFVIRGPGREYFSLEQPLDQQTVYPHGRQKVKVSFHPGRRGRSSARLYFRVDRLSHSIDLLGEGLAPDQIIIQGQVLSRKEDKPLTANVACYDLKTNRLIDSVHAAREGSFTLRINPGRTYRVTADRDQYMPGSINVDLTGQQQKDTLRRTLYLSSILPGSSVTLNNVFFEYAKARLTDASLGEIEQVARFLKKNESLRIEIAGHTDSIGTRAGNMILSQERAKAVRNQLIKEGVDPSRIQAKGYGESRPVADNRTHEGRQRNRRVVFTILED